MKMDNNQKKYIRNLLLTTAFGGLIGFINYLFNIFIARYTNESIFALYSTAIGLIYLIQIPFISIQNILTKGIGETKDGDISKLKYRSIVSFSLLGFFLSLIFFLLIPAITTQEQISNELILPLSFTLILTFISPISRGIILGKEKIVLFNVIWFLETVLRFLIGLVGIKMGGNIDILILASAIPSFLSFLITIPFLKSKKSDVKSIKIDYKGIVLMTISFLLLSAPYTLDLILTPQSLKAEYGALSLIGKIVYFSCTTLAVVLFARLSNQKTHKEKMKTLTLTVLATLVIGLVMSLFIHIFQDFILDFAYGGKYLDISKYFLTYGIAMSAYAVVYMFANFFFSKDSYWYILVLLFITVLQVLLFNNDISDVNSIVNIQIVVYSTLFILTLFYFIYNFIFKQNERENQKSC
jgi:O-antigen/teichoic acid export membrane protein